eukprot:3021755-Rhodomonas_salina.1
MVASWRHDQDGGSYSLGGTLVLGQYQGSLGGGFDRDQAFAGYMTEVRFWNVTRTEQQIQDAMYVRLPAVFESCDDDHGNCHNTNGSFTCSCVPGYESVDGGISCELDVDECAFGLHNCDTNALCTNSVGGFSCACNAGWLGDGTICADLNECVAVRQTVTTDVNGVFMFSNVGAAVDGVIDNGLWASSPFVEAASCSD